MRYSLLCEGLLEGLWHFVFHAKLWKHQAAGAIRRRIPPGKTIQFLGDEVVIPPEAFGIFNTLRETGEIAIAPAL